ncbi:MAG: H-NS family nucleoid-associated regulatory protein [Rubrivivax sp.]
MPTVAELLAQKAELEKQIAEVQREQRSSAISQIRQLMSDQGLTLADLSGRSGTSSGGPGAPRGPRAGGKVAAKYRDDAGNTWSGRGLQPKWLKAAIASGKQLSDFAV